MFGMSGHGRLPDCPDLECGPNFGEPDFWFGVGFEGVVGVVVVPLVPVPLVPAVVSVPLGAAAAPAMPAAAPPVASAPATIVAPSIFDTCMVKPPVDGSRTAVVRAIVHPAAKRARRGV